MALAKMKCFPQDYRLSTANLPDQKMNKYPLHGLCYVLSEAFYHLHPQFDLKPMRARFHGVCHWWLVERTTGKIVDPTAEQFAQPFPYHKGIGCGFLTKKPCKRTQAILALLT